jgi:HlyD family secretion protein
LSASDRDQARSRRDSALASRDQMRARLRLLQEGTRPEQVREAEAAVTRARAALAELETSAALYEVRAPRTGWIEALPYELGERPPAGAPVVVMLAEGRHTRESTRPSRSAPTWLRAAGRHYYRRRRGHADGTVRFISAKQHSPTTR